MDDVERSQRLKLRNCGHIFCGECVAGTLKAALAKLGLLTQQAKIVPIPTSAYPTPAVRPHYSVLDKASTFEALGGPTPHWRDNLRIMMDAIKTNG